jgi:hypothetical protein
LARIVRQSQSKDLRLFFNELTHHTGLHLNQMLNRGYAYTTIIGSKYHGQNLLSHLATFIPTQPHKPGNKI